MTPSPIDPMSTPKRTKELRMPIGLDAAGRTEGMAIGHVVETDFGDGRIRRDFEINLSVLNPVLFQMVKPFAKGSAFIVIPGVEFARKYKLPQGEEAGEEAQTGDNV